MEFDTEEENAKQLRQIIGSSLPEENELIITEEGTIILDEEGPITAEEIGKPVGDPILCGC
jgi:hypothetical protein